MIEAALHALRKFSRVSHWLPDISHKLQAWNPLTPDDVTGNIPISTPLLLLLGFPQRSSYFY